MKTIINFYQYKPRLRLCTELDIPAAQIGDIIFVPIKMFTEVGKPYKSKHSFHFKIISRTINCCYFRGPILDIHLKLTEIE